MSYSNKPMNIGFPPKKGKVLDEEDFDKQIALNSTTRIKLSSFNESSMLGNELNKANSPELQNLLNNIEYSEPQVVSEKKKLANKSSNDSLFSDDESGNKKSDTMMLADFLKAGPPPGFNTPPPSPPSSKRGTGFFSSFKKKDKKKDKQPQQNDFVQPAKPPSNYGYVPAKPQKQSPPMASAPQFEQVPTPQNAQQQYEMQKQMQMQYEMQQQYEQQQAELQKLEMQKQYEQQQRQQFELQQKQQMEQQQKAQYEQQQQKAQYEQPQQYPPEEPPQNDNYDEQGYPFENNEDNRESLLVFDREVIENTDFNASFIEVPETLRNMKIKASHNKGVSFAPSPVLSDDEYSDIPHPQPPGADRISQDFADYYDTYNNGSQEDLRDDRASFQMRKPNIGSRQSSLRNLGQGDRNSIPPSQLSRSSSLDNNMRQSPMPNVMPMPQPQREEIQRQESFTEPETQQPMEEEAKERKKKKVRHVQLQTKPMAVPTQHVNVQTEPVQIGNGNQDQLLAEIERLKSELAAAKQENENTLSLMQEQKRGFDKLSAQAYKKIKELLTDRNIMTIEIKSLKSQVIV
ncbi:hypothetical protein HK103_000600 [Boothiomyces macroporosus]|uniref:Uncharacterized protein n=1 Tax=Boothiomyces macroporosus TaxID=261099 RepID=A0AAD5Y5F9_9FUNG|nr:hypothetical protein HK103_000600 [Boothiomyces macroporosus]